jgi:hypothetical protein
MARTRQRRAAIKRAEVALGIRWTMPAGVTAKRIYAASPFVRIELVRGGVPASFVANLSQAMKVSRERIYRTMGLPRATVERKVREEQSLNAEESGRNSCRGPDASGARPSTSRSYLAPVSSHEAWPGCDYSALYRSLPTCG